MNGYYTETGFSYQSQINLGIVISRRGGGLLAPTINDVANLSLEVIGSRLADLIRRSRSGKLYSSEIDKPTLTITSLGENGVDSVFGVIHHPQVALIGAGRIRDRPWVENDMIGAIPIMTLSLSGDHRVSDGHRGGKFLNCIATALQKPENL